MIKRFILNTILGITWGIIFGFWVHLPMAIELPMIIFVSFIGCRILGVCLPKNSAKEGVGDE